MEFWISGELDSEVAELFGPIGKVIEATLNERLGRNDYGDVVAKIALIPIILGPRFQGAQKERRLIKSKEKIADYRLYISFQAFAAGTEKERKGLLLENLLTAVEDIERKSKGKFHGKKLSQDIRREFHDILGNR
jgi:Immunity protein 44